MARKPITNLHSIAKFAFFVTSYLPLFILIIVRQLVENHEYLVWGGISKGTLGIFANKFGLTTALLIVSAFGCLGAFVTITNIESSAKNGFPVNLEDVKNKNNESIGYIATYIIPFLFQNLGGLYELFSILFLLLVIYAIYTNSSMLIVNPVLGIWYSIYEVTFERNGKNRNGMVVSRSASLLEGDQAKLYEIGFKMYFATEIDATEGEN